MARALPPNPKPDEIARTVNQINKGYTANSGSITLSTSTTTTSLANDLIHPGTKVHLNPASASAQSETPWQGTTVAGQATLNHTSSTASDRTYNYILTG